MIWLTPKPSQSVFVHSIQSKETFFLQKNSFLKKKRKRRIEKNRKEGVLIALTTVIKKVSTMPIKCMLCGQQSN